MKQKLLKDLFLSLFYSGYAPKAPGTVGSALACALGAPILYLSSQTLFLLAVFIGLASIRAIDAYEAHSNTHDDRSIVIDELVGVWLAMSFVGFGLAQILCAFVLFRIFDVWKPSVIGKIDKSVKGGAGVVGDDALAGVISGIMGLAIFELLARFEILTWI